MAGVSASELEVLVRTFDSKHPGVVLRNGFFRTAAIVDGIRGRTKNEDLGRFFEAFGDVRAVVADKQGCRGERVGLVVFPDVGNCSAATNQTSGNYKSILKVSSIGIDREFLINAVRRPKRRQPNPRRRVPANSVHNVERRKQAALAPAPEQEVAASPAPPYPGVPEEAVELVKKVTMLSIEHCSSADSKGIVEGLIRLAAVSRPDVLLHKFFSDRAVLLMGIDAGTSESDLRSELGSTFGELDLLAVHGEQGVALAVFKSWKGSVKLRRQPAKNLRRLGVDRCGRVPRELDVATLVSGASDMVHSFGETYGRALSYVDSRSASSGMPTGG